MSHRLKVLSFLFTLTAIFTISLPSFAAGVWNYGITDSDTLSIIDENKTDAFIDTVKNEITLPLLPVPNMAAFSANENIEYYLLTEEGVKAYSFDGHEVVSNNLLEVPTTDAVAAVAPAPYPTITVASENGVKVYSFSGSKMEEVPALEITGLNNVISVGTIDRSSISVLDTKGNIYSYNFDGNEMIKNTLLEPSTDITNPVAVAAADDYSIAILEKDQIKYYSLTAGGLTENPAFSVAGLSEAKSFAVTDNGIDVIDGNELKHYSFDGNEMVYNPILSITSGLTKPQAVAVRTGTNDKLIIDGNRARYFQFDGSGYIENENLSVTVSNLIKGDKYQDYAVVQSKPVNPGSAADMIRVHAFQELPESTAITWSVSADEGTNWVTRWRTRGTVSGTVLEISDDNGLTWTEKGTALESFPGINNKLLWAEVTPGNRVIWKAELSTTNKLVTPKIYASAGTAIMWEANAKPKPPSIDDNTVNGWYYTTTPELSWRFNDTDTGDSQTAFQLRIKKQTDDSIIYDSSKVISQDEKYTVPTSYDSEVNGPLWNSGAYKFSLEVRTWDSMDCVSEWSNAINFKILAFERPRIAEIINPPTGQVSPEINNPSTHIMIKPGMDISELPKAKAGARITLIIDSVGPINGSLDSLIKALYGTNAATIGEATSINPTGSSTNRYTIPFWTDASLEEVPSGTIITLLASSTGTEGGTTYFEVPDSNTGDIYPGYEDTPGIIVTEGTIYEDWMVLMKGSE